MGTGGEGEDQCDGSVVVYTGQSLVRGQTNVQET